jgi:capsular polysaccharide export protein
MVFRRSIKKSYKAKDKHLTRSLLKDIKLIDLKKSVYLFIFSQEKSSFSRRLFTLISHELSVINIPSIFLYQDDPISSRFPTLSINGFQISNSLRYGKHKGDIESDNLNGYYFDWTIDLEKQTIEAYNTNFFPLILNTLRTIQKRYNVDLNNSKNEITINNLIKSCDLLLHYFLLLKEFSSKNNKKIRIVGFENYYVPNGVFHILCDKFSDNRDIEYIELRRGYISYFGKHHFRDSFITCTNLIKEKVFHGIALSDEELNAIDEKKIDLDTLSKPLLTAVTKTPFSSFSENQKTVINRINKYLEDNRKVFVLFAHLFFDVPLDDSSNSFNDMCEWIKFTIEYFKGNENLLLLKPHPAELRPDEPKKIPNETLKSYLEKSQLSKNILLLEPREFSLLELAPYVSCGLIWRSSVAMELTFLGVPTIIAGTPIYHLLPLNYSNSRQNYFQMIDNIDDIEVTKSQKIEVAKYLSLLKRKHVHVDCITYNANARKVLWNREILEKYLKKGDVKIRSIIEKILL